MNAENKTDETQAQAEILPEQLSLKSRFKFKCHKGVSCFTECCRGIDIMLTPYDILTMREKLDLDSEKFLAIFTTPHLLEKADLPVVTIKLLDDERRSCPFVQDKEGCMIYEDRPTTCRYYPLGVGSLSYSGEQTDGDKDEFFFMIKEPHCKGFDEEDEWTVGEWREDQGVDLRDEVNEGWLDLMVRKKSLPASMQLSEQAKQMFFTVCYNIDKFKRFVFESSFLTRYNIPEERVAQIKDDDVKLLQFGFEWLKNTFFQTGEEMFNPKDENGDTTAAE
ncbi:YkgJ family cysteine cluster protein [Desulfobacter hydrogenophilus]|uniref:YkgJ family cysteine cluster protein n=1 Tax=Desulfobacter hydrogenophilus TaxID=2291 RepID=A0A328FDY8_9BACT|nr:YkgJ family cysteine cluster protein [Desulfobacter hydrogenophilus]NDY72566.1 YkgJ family cysteine cluster protein [Desulfobacter hydrogenophilus]QBH13289.1 YkgJ family cysteine cluster protein [Desulfobacter hydrogenophilus]RAM01313.1 YkgJ family cysteine cluster protein [Desulfobacter hydrogenophilus]